MNDLLAMSGAAYDAQSLNALKYSTARDPQGNHKQVAQQVEGLFVQMMLKSMRAALPQGGLFNSEQTKLYTSLYDQQIAQQLSLKGLGLADIIEQQLSGQPSLSENAGTVRMALDDSVLQTLPTQALAQIMRSPGFQSQSGAPLQSGLQRHIERQSLSDAADTAYSHPLSLNSHNFMAHLSLPAKVASQQSGIPHQLIVAQAALESGWGQREIPTAAGKSSYNLFGIKAGKSWNGPVTEVTTTEYEQGIAKNIKARFRVYGSYVEAISDYVKLLTTNPRYANVASARSPEQAAHALQQAGYATDPQYAKKLVSLIQQMKNLGERAVKAYTHDLSQIF